MAKLVQVSDDAGMNWYTLPGATGSFELNATDIDDTIFGQTYQSNESGLITWNANANAFYKGFAGYVATLKKQGSSTPVTGESFTLESGKIYAIDAAARDLWDRTATTIIYDNAIDQTANVEWIDFLFGRVKFLDAYTVIAPVTADISYFPTVVLGKANSFELTQNAEFVANTDFATAQANSGHVTGDPGLRTVAVSLTGFYDVANTFRADLISRVELVIEINPDGNLKSLSRGFFRPSTQGQSGDVGALEEETIDFNLRVPDQQGPPALLLPFNWRHAVDTTLSTAVQKMLTAFTDETKLDVRYLYDGTNGVSGTGVLTDVSLSGGLDVMNEFSVVFTGDGATAVVGTG